MTRILTIVIALTIAAATPGMAQKNKAKAGKDTGGAPAFCRSGAGHPKYGRSWCLEKGFGLGQARWNRVTWSDVVFRTRRTPTLGEVLGSVVLGRLSTYAARQLGYNTPLTGSWLVSEPDRTVYIVRSGSYPVAEMADTNRDGRADYVLLYQR